MYSHISKISAPPYGPPSTPPTPPMPEFRVTARDTLQNHLFWSQTGQYHGHSCRTDPALRERICELYAIGWGYKRIYKRYLYVSLSTIQY